MSARLFLVLTLTGCYDVGALSRHYNADQGVPDAGVVTDGGVAVSVTVWAGAAGGAGSANGVSAAAFLDQPSGVAVDDTSFYVTDVGSHTVFRIDRGSLAVTRLVGHPYHPGYGPDQLDAPARALALNGSLYISEAVNQIVRRLDGSTLTIVAGSPGIYGDCGSGHLANPRGMTTDGSMIYVANEDDNTICAVDPTPGGMMTVVTGSSDSTGYGYADGEPTVALFRSPVGLAYTGPGVDPQLVIVDGNNRLLRTYDFKSAMTSTLAGTQGQCFDASGPPLIDGAAMCSASDITVSNGVLYFTDGGDNGVRWVDTANAKLQLLAGGPTSGSADGVGGAAQFNGVQGIVAYTDSEGKAALLVADQSNHLVRSVDIATATVSTVAGSREQAGSTNGPLTTARFAGPLGLATDGKVVYVADSRNGSIRQIADGNVTTLALAAGGSGVLPASPTALALASDQTLYVTDATLGEVFHVVSDGQKWIVDLLIPSAASTDASTLLANPLGIAVDDDTIYVADTGHDLVRTFDLAGNLTGRVDLGTDGVASVGCGGPGLTGPTGLALDASTRTLYIAANGNCQVYAYDVTTRTGRLLAGNERGYMDGPALGALFDAPFSLALDGQGHLAISDYGNATIRLLTPGAGSSVTTYAGSPMQFGIVAGAAPAQINRGFGLAYVAGTGLVASMPNENSLVVIQ